MSLSVKSKLGFILILSLLLFFTGENKLYGAFADDNQLVFKDDMTVYQMSALYHEKMNTLFNKKAKLLITGKEDEIDEKVPDDGEKAALIKYCKGHPQDEQCEPIDQVIQQCKDDPDSEDCMQAHDQCILKTNNITTFCVAIESSHLYIKYKDALMLKWNYVDFDEDLTLAEMLRETRGKRDFIAGDIDLSKKTLDSTLNAFNELRWSFAIHKQYKQIIKDLLKYRDKIADVRKYVEQYPDRFYNASTPYCE